MRGRRSNKKQSLPCQTVVTRALVRPHPLDGSLKVNSARVGTLGGWDLVGRIGKVASKVHRLDVIHATLDRYSVLLAAEWQLLV